LNRSARESDRAWLPLWLQVLLGLLAGSVAGVVVPELTAWWAPLGELFLRLIKMLVGPLIFVSLVGAVSHLGSLGRLGRIGIKTFSIYFLTTAMAIPLGLLVAAMLQPGAGIEFGVVRGESPPAAPPLNRWTDLVPVSPVAAFADGNTLQIIVFSLLLGVGACIAGERAEGFNRFIDSAAAVVLSLTDIVIRFAPVGVFALMSVVTAEYGLSVLLPLLKLVLTVYLGCILHLAVTISLLLRRLAGVSPLQFFRGIVEAQILAFSTTTAAGTLPVTMACTRNNLGVSDEVSAFVLPVGATVNMDGTALYQAVVAVFVAQAYGLDLQPTHFMAIGSTAFIASVGTAAVPAAGLVVLSMVLAAAGLPVEGIALVAGIDRILDMARTTVNVTGDAAVATIVARYEGALDRSIFNASPE